MSLKRILVLFFLSFVSTSQWLRSGDTKDFFVFLITGESTQGVAPDDIKQKQAAHLENFGRLAKLGSLTAAGPCSDPAKMVRGIVVLKAESTLDGEKMFISDPYVSEGFMKTDMHEYQPIAGKFQLDLDSNSLEQYVIVILKKGIQWPTDGAAVAAVEDSLSLYAKERFALKELGFAGIFKGESKAESDRLGVMIYRSKDLASVKGTLESLPWIKEKSIAFDAFPQFMAKQALAE